MDWQEIGTFTLTNDWQYSERVTSKVFKVTYLSSPLLGRDSTGTIALSSLDTLNNESVEFFRPQRVNAYLLSEIIRFPDPPRGWDYRLAIRKLVLPKQQTANFTIQIFMPVQDLTPDQSPVNPTISTTKNAISVNVGPTTTAVKLLPASTGNTRKHATFFLPTTAGTRNLYIDTDSTINTASAIAKLTPGKVYISDLPNWQGEYWGVLDGNGSTAIAVAVEEYV